MDEQRKDPAISPLYADLTGLPPALFSAAGADALRDDSVFMSWRWKAAGNESDLVVFPECTHVFIAFPTKMAAAANERIEAFVRQRARG